MALIISTNGKSAFRSEQIDAVFQVVDDKTHRLTNKVALLFKSGAQQIVVCKTIKEATKFKDIIINIMKNDRTL